MRQSPEGGNPQRLARRAHRIRKDPMPGRLDTVTDWAVEARTAHYNAAHLASMRKATDKHPVSKLIKRVEELLPHLKLPFQAGTLARFG